MNSDWQVVNNELSLSGVHVVVSPPLSLGGTCRFSGSGCPDPGFGFPFSGSGFRVSGVHVVVGADARVEDGIQVRKVLGVQFCLLQGGNASLLT